MSSTKSKKFNKVLSKAKEALDSVDIQFHLHAGTALGAHREKDFIKHDHDIDLAVFYKDVDTSYKVQKVVKAMEDVGFEVVAKLGKLSRGKEIQFEMSGVPLDIFWIYEGEYRGKKYFLVSSYYGQCDELKYKTCVWGYNPYKTVKVDFLGQEYNCIPQHTLVDMYGSDWKTPKKFGYYEGITQGGYKGFLKDYYQPRPTDMKIAFCFLLYDTVNHRKLWEKFFSQDNYPENSYSIYSHLKTETDKTPNWISKNKIKTIETGWCEESLVDAWINLLKAALKDENNKYFVILSGECIPLFTYQEIYNKITKSKKSRINPDKNTEVYSLTGLYYADQWVILNRKHAELLVALRTSAKGKQFVEAIRKRTKVEVDNEVLEFCPDEVYPINWFIENYGRPTTQSFKKEFNIGPSTYTYWDTNSPKPHPTKFNTPKMEKFKAKICSCGALFGRKFNSKAARELGMTCGE